MSVSSNLTWLRRDPRRDQIIEGEHSMYDLNPADTRVFLFHSSSAANDPSAAMDDVNAWLGKDRSTSAYSNLKVRDIRVTPDGSGGVYVSVVCTLGRVSTGTVNTVSRGRREQFVEDESSASEDV